MRLMSTAFLDDIQIDEFDCIVPFDEMFDLFEDDFETMTESDQNDWSMIQE